MNIIKLHLPSAAKLVSILAFATLTPAAFAASTWNLDQCGTDNNLSTTNPVIGSSTVNGYLQSTGSGCVQGTNVAGNSVHAYAYSVSNVAGSTFSTANLLQHGAGYGLGVQSGTEGTGDVPNHTMDNQDRTELIAIHFDTAVALDKITLGWTSSDADITLMAYTGAGAPTIAGKTMANLAAGWSLVKNYGDGAPDTAYADNGTDINVTVNSGSVVSSWWLISAFNINYGGTGISTPDSLADYVKIMTLTSKDVTTNVPEPGSLALLGAGLFGIVAARRRAIGKA